MSDLERRLSEEEQDIERGALTDWEVQYARAKLDLKEKHYKVRTRLQIKEGGNVYEKGLLLQTFLKFVQNLNPFKKNVWLHWFEVKPKICSTEN